VVTESSRVRTPEAGLLEAEQLGAGVAALSQHGLLIDTLTACVGSVVGAGSVSGVLPEALARIASVIRVDRMVFAEEATPPAAAARLLFRWQAAPSSTSSGAHWLERFGAEQLSALLPALAAGESVLVARRGAPEALRAALLESGVMTALVVPIRADGRHCGHIAFDDCRDERRWSSEDVKLLGMLAGIIGAALTREQHLQALDAAQEKIALLARTDALTGLANRMTFNERLRQAFAASQRGAHAFAVLYLDLDRFKEVNDSLGHHTGDLLLQQVGRRLQEITREIDLVARLGGDEFAIVQTELVDSSSAGTLAEKLVEVLSAPYSIEGNELRIGVSVGIALYNAESRSPDALLAQADQALYRAKHAGRGRYRFHSDQIDHETRTQLALADGLRGAAERGELEIRYQPQVELATGRIVGMEALLRWNHPDRGVLLPEDFLPIAEKFGLMQQVGRWVLGEACRQLARWRAEQVPVPVLAINVALAQIRMGREFVRDVLESLAQHGLSPSDIELDVTELVLVRSTLAHSAVLEELRQAGVGIAIDDFGAQYSSLDYLRTYRVNRLKIARGMIAAADIEPGGSAMIRAILSLARELGIEVVAEGVETESQCRLLVNASPHAQGQGFYYSHAVSAEESLPMLRAGVVLPP
jgi:diguanylate cyclase (GGDEF)-like protein